MRGQSLTDFDNKLLRALAAGLPLRAAAEVAEVTYYRAQKRLHDPDFAAQLDAFNDEADQRAGPEARALYRALAKLRSANAILASTDDRHFTITGDASRETCRKTIEWVEEWIWLEQTEGPLAGEEACAA